MKPVASLTDAEVLEATGHGKFGPAIVGEELFARSSKIMKATGGGVFGPAITDPDYATKQAAAKAAKPAKRAASPASDGVASFQEDGYAGDGADLNDPRNPWTYVTLGGAKILAQRASVNYVPKVKRVELIADLQAAGVVPPPVPSDNDEADSE